MEEVNRKFAIILKLLNFYFWRMEMEIKERQIKLNIEEIESIIKIQTI